MLNAPIAIIIAVLVVAARTANMMAAPVVAALIAFVMAPAPIANIIAAPISDC